MKKKTRLLAIGLSLVMMLAGCGGSMQVGEDAPAATESGDRIDSGYAEKATEAAAEADFAMEAPAAQEKYEEIAAEEEAAYRFDYNDQDVSGENYERITEEGYQSALRNPLSTFSVDVDTASYSNIRRYLTDGQLPPEDAVKIEEMINYFSYDYDQPDGEEPFSIHTEVGPCPWNEDSHLAMIGLQGLEIEKEDRPSTNLVFLLDVSGSMNNRDKLPLLKEAFSMLTEELDENDRVSIVVYAGSSGVVLDGATGDEKSLIIRKLDQLEAGGSTAGSEGIQLAYQVALDHYIYNGNNRVILATDGDFNVGLTSISALEDFISNKKEEGVFLSVLGFGTGNTDFYTMETLADKGNGHFAYIDSVKEAEKVLVNELTGTLYTIAKDVKIQVEFNPAVISGYRLVGYENRVLADRDFDNDRVDAGDIGAGHRVTALYEIQFNEDYVGTNSDLRYQESRETKDIDGELMYVKLRYKHPKSDRSQLIEMPIHSDLLDRQLSDDFLLASSVAELGLILRDSRYGREAAFDHIFEAMDATSRRYGDEYVDEFIELVEEAERLIR